MYIGAHVSTSGGLKKAIERGQNIGAEALQIFPSAPVQWNIRGFPEGDLAVFKIAWPDYFKEVVFHGIYLVNLATGDHENHKKGIKALTDSLALAPDAGISKLIFHTGSYVNGKIERREQIAEAIWQVLENTPASTKLVFENTAGSTIGAKLEDLAWLMKVANNPKRIGVCLDTCHAFASGYDLSGEAGYEKFMIEVGRIIGLKNVLAWHLNDSKFDLGGKRDRHENIGEGKLGLKAFELLVNDKRWEDTAGYLEVPGFENEGPDKKNIDILKSLRK